MGRRLRIFRELQESGELENLTLGEVEDRLEIHTSHRDYPNYRYCCGPKSNYYFQFRDSFKKMHKGATKALAWLDKYLSAT